MYWENEAFITLIFFSRDEPDLNTYFSVEVMSSMIPDT